MLDAILRRQTETALAPIAARLAHWGIRANALTLSAFICGAVALLDIGHRYYLVGLVLLALGRVFDSLDGPVARWEGATATGAFLDTTLDLLIAAAIPFAFALAQPDRALAAMFLMLGLVARAGTAIGAGRDGGGMLAAAAGSLGALIGKSELFVAFALACIFPNWFSIIAYTLGIACFIGMGARLAVVLANSSP